MVRVCTSDCSMNLDAMVFLITAGSFCAVLVLLCLRSFPSIRFILLTRH
jgi:hypothetical protein